MSKRQLTFDDVPERRRFDGETYEPAQDCARLTKGLQRVYEIVRNGRWITLRELSDRIGCTEAAASARLRDLRKQKFGGHRVDRERVSGGLYRYRVVLPGDGGRHGE